MINYNWNCETVDVYPTEGELKDVVYNVHWIVTGVNDSVPPVQSNIYGTQVLNTSDITNFIPVDQLTNGEIVAWTQSAMGEEQVALIEANIANQIELLINPVSITMTIK
jgi:alkyl hydroperoxide reductase subunit AhpF